MDMQYVQTPSLVFELDLERVLLFTPQLARQTAGSSA